MTNFNEGQLQAINFYKGACGVVASAGSGKSTVLIERIRKIVFEHGESQSDILAISFTSKTAEELKNKLEKSRLDKVNVGTFHALCMRIMLSEGIDVRGKLVPEWKAENWFKEIDDRPDTKEILGFISYQKSYMKSPTDKFVKINSNYTENELKKFYQIYETRKKQDGLYDFDDYLLIALELLKKNKGKYTFEFVLVDEHQDSNLVQNEILKEICESGNIFVVGDIRQCFPSNTKISTPNGYVNISDIKNDDLIRVANGRGGFTDVKVSEKMSKEYTGKMIKVTTKSGKTIEATPEHMIFIDTIAKDKNFVYLMYKEGLGFRIGRSSYISTTKDGKIVSRNGYEKRLTDENGDMVWLLDSFDKIEDAIFFENYYSFEYGIPQYVFNHKGRNISLKQDGINRLFKSIDTTERGLKLLSDKNMFFDYPHYIPQANNNSRCNRPTLTMFGSDRYCKGKNSNYIGYSHELSSSSVNKDYIRMLDKKFDKTTSKKKNGNGLEYYAFRVANGNLDSILSSTEELVNENDNIKLRQRAILTEKLTDKFELLPISNAKEGMSVAMLHNGRIMKDEIINVEITMYSGFVYDLNVDNYRNYLANDIVVHNCIYSFRASNIKFFMNFSEYWENSTIINLFMNYRSTDNIVNKSNEFIKPYFKKYAHYVDSEAYNKKDGVIKSLTFQDEAYEAIGIVDLIEKMLEDGVDPSEIAILYRLNANSMYIENELKNRDIDYDITNNSSFFKRKEVEAIVCYLRLILDPSDDGALETIFKFRTYPMKFFSNSVFDGIRNHARINNMSLFDALVEYNFEKAWQVKSAKDFIKIINNLHSQVDNGANVTALINNIVVLFSFEDYIKDKYKSKEEVKERIKSVEVLKTFVKNNNLEQFISFVYNSVTKKRVKENVIKLMTIHASKGLEWENVLLVGVEDGKFPHELADENEEARLFYVGITRPKKNLWISQLGKSNKFVNQYFGQKQKSIDKYI